jgi:hypothetical protein
MNRVIPLCEEKRAITEEGGYVEVDDEGPPPGHVSTRRLPRGRGELPTEGRFTEAGEIRVPGSRSAALEVSLTMNRTICSMMDWDNLFGTMGSIS